MRLKHTALKARITPRYRIPAIWQPWIYLAGSMTREIARVKGRQPTVALLYQGPDRLTHWEARLLGVKQRRRVYAREISLNIGAEPMLYARSVTALPSTLPSMLQGLGNKPLAEVLFTDPAWQRLQTPTALLSPGTEKPPGRASVWSYAGRSSHLLVTEFFQSNLLRQS